MSQASLTLQTIYDPEEAGQGPPMLDLVLVHGLNGDRIMTFTHEKTKVFWPRDLLPKKQPRTRVLSFGYSADILGNTSVAGIRGNSRALLSRLCDYRDDVDPSTPIVFIAHSLGGLIVKQALRFANSESEYYPLATATRGFLFYGTPHAGADRDRWLSLCQKTSGLMPTSRGQINPLVDALTRNSDDIVNICEDFRKLARCYAIVSFYETLAGPGLKPIVDKMSALMHLDHEDLVPLGVNHLDLCRFRDANDDGFRSTVRRIKMMTENMPPQGHAVGHVTNYNQVVYVNSKAK